MKVRYSPRSVSDIEGIADYLKERSVRAPAAMESAIRTIVQLIAEFPNCGRAVEQRTGVRVIPLGRYPYLIFYTIQDETAVILHIRHGSRIPLVPDEL